MLSDSQIVRALAEKVFGWHKAEGGSRSAGWLEQTERGPGCGRIAAYPEWNPLERDSDTCQVLDKMASDGWIIELRFYPGAVLPGDWACRMQKNGSEWTNPSIIDSNRRRAICLASLKALGVDVGETVLRPSEEP